MRRSTHYFVAGALIALVGCTSEAAETMDTPAENTPAAEPMPMGAQNAMQMNPVDVTIIDRDGQQVGTATLTQDTAGVRIQVQASGLTPGGHGLHIHSRGACDAPDFSSAGPHYSPENRSHGFLDSQGPHAGDLPTLEVAAQGGSDYDFTTGRVSLSEQSLLSSEGSSLIVHAQPDDYLTDTGGGTGDRIACGVISPAGAGMQPM